jgi:hypothetical protein
MVSNFFWVHFVSKPVLYINVKFMIFRISEWSIWRKFFNLIYSLFVTSYFRNEQPKIKRPLFYGLIFLPVPRRWLRPHQLMWRLLIKVLIAHSHYLTTNKNDFVSEPVSGVLLELWSAPGLSSPLPRSLKNKS